jgi:hypothetical protein
MGQGKRSKSLALLMTTGYMRLSSKLLPEKSRKGKRLGFYVKGDLHKRLIELQPTWGNGKGPWPKRMAAYSNAGAKSPAVSVRGALHYIGVDLPKKATGYDVKKRKDGTLVVKF